MTDPILSSEDSPSVPSQGESPISDATDSWPGFGSPPRHPDDRSSVMQWVVGIGFGLFLLAMFAGYFYCATSIAPPKLKDLIRL